MLAQPNKPLPQHLAEQQNRLSRILENANTKNTGFINTAAIRHITPPGKQSYHLNEGLVDKDLLAKLQGDDAGFFKFAVSTVDRMPDLLDHHLDRKETGSIKTAYLNAVESGVVLSLHEHERAMDIIHRHAEQKLDPAARASEGEVEMEKLVLDITSRTETVEDKERVRPASERVQAFAGIQAEYSQWEAKELSNEKTVLPRVLKAGAKWAELERNAKEGKLA